MTEAYKRFTVVICCGTMTTMAANLAATIIQGESVMITAIINTAGICITFLTALVVLFYTVKKEGSRSKDILDGIKELCSNMSKLIFRQATIGKNLDRLTNTVSSIDKMMVSVQKDQQQHKESISQLSLNEKEINKNIDNLRNLSEVLANQRSEIIRLNAELAMKNEKIASLEKEVQEKDFLISSLQHEKTFSPQRKFVSREDDLEH